MKSSKYRLLALLLIAGLLALPLIIRNAYYLHLTSMVFVNAILGMGFALIYSTGLITLGASAFWGVGAYTSTLLVTKLGWSSWLAMPAAAIMAGIFAFLCGSLMVRYAGVGFVVFTLLMCFVMERVFAYVKVFGGWGGIIGIPPPDSIPLPFSQAVEFSSKIPFYYLSLLLLTITVVCFYGFYSSRIGRAWRAVRLDPRLAESIGVHLYAYRLTAFIAASVFAGLAGSFYAHFSMIINPETFGILKSIYIQIYAILGGLEYYILGPIAGSVVFTLLPQFLQISPEIEPYVTGCVLILIVIFLPDGLVGLVQRVLQVISRFRAAPKEKQPNS